MSPGLTSRPSLSDPGVDAPAADLLVSPGLTSRPSLSDAGCDHRPDVRAGVAGTHVPAFVERSALLGAWRTGRGVTGTQVLAFVDRPFFLRSSPPCRLRAARARGRQIR